MKREIVAAALLLLMFAASIFNISHLDRLVGAVEAELGTAERYAAEGDFTKSLAALDRARRSWDGARSYTHIFIRHPEIDAVSDAFHAAESELSGGNTQSAGAALRLLRYHLDSIREMEQLRPGSILSFISYR